MSGLDGESARRALRYLDARRRSGSDVVFRVSGAAPIIKSDVLLKTSPESPEADSVGGRNLKEGIRFSGGDDGGSNLFAPEGVSVDETGNMSLKELEKAVEGCTKCALASTRNRTVFGDGDPSAGIVFIGEAPGRDEDLQGVPFVGRAGKLLDKILAAIEFSRKDVYIANILKCRPPNNLDPEEKEVNACEAYLKRQLEIIDPVIICALGRVAAQNLLRTKASMKVLREGIHYYNETKVLVTYHPAALLRNPSLKRPAWEDMKLLRRLYDDAIAGQA